MLSRKEPRTRLVTSSFVALAACSAWSLFACDDPKAKWEDKAKAQTADAALAVALAAPSASAAPATSAVPVAKKKECGPPNEVGTLAPELDAAVRVKLAKKPGEALTVTDLAQVKSVRLTDAKLDDLDPCFFPKLTGLHFLYLGKGEYDDLTPISSLVHLETVVAFANRVKDVGPLAKMSALDQLDLSRTQVSDLKPIAGLKNVTEMSLDDAPVTDLSPLAGYAKLEKLSIKRTLVSDLSPLKDLKKLKRLAIGGTAIADTSPLQALVAGGLKIDIK